MPCGVRDRAPAGINTSNKVNVIKSTRFDVIGKKNFQLLLILSYLYEIFTFCKECFGMVILCCITAIPTRHTINDI